MNKRSLHHVWAKLRPVSYWYFLAGFVAFSLLFVFNYRKNNVNMLALRDKVFVADEQNGDIEKALRNLREYVYSHMNTRLVSGPTAIRPPIQLKHEYERRVAAEQARVDAQNADLRKEAEATCKQKFPKTANATGIAPCIEGYMNEKGVIAQPVLKEFYQFDFVSPAWSPDVAGWSLVLAIIFGLLFIVRYGLERWLRHELHEHA
jgi:hypothetical protein